jgi:Ca2+ transporting ATPase
VEVHHISRTGPDSHLGFHPLQRYFIDYAGPQVFGIPSSIGVSDWNDETGKHYSIFFNVFVLMQVFNEINARKLKSEEYNVFEDFFNNKLFLIIVVSTIIIQLTMVKYGGKSLQTVELSFKENLLCLVLGSSSLLSALLFKVILPHHLVVSLYGI